MIESIQLKLQKDGIDVPVTKLCDWFDVPRRTFYYKPVKKAPVVQDRFAKPIKEMIEEQPAFGYQQFPGFLGSIRTPSSLSSSSKAGSVRNCQWDSGHEFRHYLQW